MSPETLFYSCQFFVSLNDAHVRRKLLGATFSRAVVTDQSSIVMSIEISFISKHFWPWEWTAFSQCNGHMRQWAWRINLNELNTSDWSWIHFGRATCGHCVRTTKTVEIQKCKTASSCGTNESLQREREMNLLFSALSLTAFQTG